MKRCIFHYPHPVLDKPGIGSTLRPNQMRAAFERIGYQVDEISGYGTERKKKIAIIKRNIQYGVQYDFVYSESVNIPMLLTDHDHLPRHPFMDFSFFRFCKKNGIPVGLFYRDMHWKFPVYLEQVALWKQRITLPLFRYDLKMYRKYVDILYVPSVQMGELIPHNMIKPLPPGGVERPDVMERRASKQQKNGCLRVFYVGNVMGVYDITNFCKAVSEAENVYLTICTPETSWKEMQKHYAPYMSDRIQVVHKSSDELQSYYEEADVFCCCLKNNAYTCLAMPIKSFESISYGVPVMVTEGIAVGELITQTDSGWVVQNSVQAYAALLTRLRDNTDEVQKKTKNVLKIAKEHTWESRARQVSAELMNLK